MRWRTFVEIFRTIVVIFVAVCRWYRTKGLKTEGTVLGLKLCGTLGCVRALHVREPVVGHVGVPEHE